MADLSWIASTIAKASAAPLDGTEMMRLIDSPGGTPASQNALTSDIRAFIRASANTFSANAAASIPPMLLSGTWFTGGSATTTKPTLLVEPAGTVSTGWSTAGTGFGVNAPSGFTGNFLDLQNVGVSQLKITKDGLISVFDSSPNGGIVVNPGSGTSMALGRNQTDGTTGVLLGPATSLGWAVTSAVSGAVDLRLNRDAAGILAQRNGVNAQEQRLYNTTDAGIANYERLSLAWSSNVAIMKTQNAGTGSARLFVPVTGATVIGSLPSASTMGAGARSFVTDALSPVFGTAVGAGGSAKVPVVSDGTSWLVG